MKLTENKVAYWFNFHHGRFLKKFFFERWAARERARGHFDSYEAWERRQ